MKPFMVIELFDDPIPGKECTGGTGPAMVKISGLKGPDTYYCREHFAEMLTTSVLTAKIVSEVVSGSLPTQSTH